MDSAEARVRWADHGYFDDEYDEYYKPKKPKVKSQILGITAYYALSSNSHSHVVEASELSGYDFEVYCAELLQNNGFVNVTVTPDSGDQGVDILAEKDSIKYAMQCKNYASVLGNTSIQEVSAGKIFYSCHVGVVMTNSTSSSSAKELAKATGVLLWDKNVLEEML